MEELEFIWKTICEELKKSHPATVVNLWFGEVYNISLTDRIFSFTVKRELKKNIIMNKFKDELEECLYDILGFEVEVICKVYADGSYTEDEKNALRELARTKKEPQKDEKTSYVNEQYTFDNFIVGSSNKFAHAACLSVVRNPSLAYNPLFIYGSSGLGKTHLMYAIKNEMKRVKPDLNVIFVKGEEFTNEFVDSLLNNTSLALRDKYRSTDILIIDDIQFIAKKERVQEEIFHTFNTLYENDKVIILTSDRPPKEIPYLEDRLKSRFEAGLLMDIQPPDIELRMAILKKKSKDLGVTLSPEIITYIADRLKENMRQMEGVLKKISALTIIAGKEISIEDVKNAISDLVENTEPQAMITDKIFAAVCRKYSLKREVLCSPSRAAKVATARHVVVYLLRSLTAIPMESIGKLINRDHSTVSNSMKIIAEKMEQDKNFENEINELISEIKD